MSPWLALLIAPLMLYWGAHWLVNGCAGLALRLGVPIVIVGLFIVGYGTSAPEVVVCLEAASTNRGALALGNVIGSNLIVSTFMVGVAALVKPLRVHWLVPKFDAPVIVLIAAALLLMFADRLLTRVEGGLLLSGFVTFTWQRWRLARRSHAAEVDSEFAQEMPRNSPRAWPDVVRVLAGLGLLAGGGWLFLDGAVAVAKHFGISLAVIGLTLVALGTCLPEMATNLVAAARGHGDIVIANAVGSCVFNSLAILGLVALVRPLDVAGFSLLPLGWFLGAALLLLPVLWTDNLVRRWEGAVLVGFFGLYLAWLLNSNTGIP